ncbi:MAG TPA: DUF4142 domain-containing protein [Burkholderiales bacterium]|nr:DUF4142 domain-containing protein [Burkholderiales bacterium]
MPLRYLVAAASAMALALGAPSVSAQGKSEEKQATGKKQGGLAKQDRDLLTRMAQSDMAEIEAGKLAAKNASSPEVKKYGEHMVQEHSKMLEEGGKLAKAKGVTPPSAPDKKHQAALKKLEGLSGEEFDRRFMQQMVRDHEEAMKLGERVAKNAKDSELKAHAEKAAPHIKEHLAQARKLHDSLGASSGASGAKRSKGESGK